MNDKNGFGLLEIIIVLGVIALLFVGGGSFVRNGLNTLGGSSEIQVGQDAIQKAKNAVQGITDESAKQALDIQNTINSAIQGAGNVFGFTAPK